MKIHQRIQQMKKSLRSQEKQVILMPFRQANELQNKVLYRKEDDEHNTEEIQEEILVPQ